jgi:hypothetical protein
MNCFLVEKFNLLYIFCFQTIYRFVLKLKPFDCLSGYLLLLYSSFSALIIVTLYWFFPGMRPFLLLIKYFDLIKFNFFLFVLFFVNQILTYFTFLFDSETCFQNTPFNTAAINQFNFISRIKHFLKKEKKNKNSS